MTGPALIDPTTAVWAASLVAPRRATAAAEVARLRAEVTADLPAVDAAARAWTALGSDLPPTRCRVVGRIGWVRANLTALDGAFDPLAAKLRTNRLVASRVLGTQVGLLLGLLSGKVLGQFVLPLGRPGTAELVVVGPNLLDLADEHGVLAADIRRTVLLHEVTHRLQFDAVDWLGPHLRQLLGRYLGAARLDPSVLTDALARIPQAVTEARDTGTVTPLLEVVLTEEQAAVIDEAQGLMTLLEGHGTAAMYAATDGVVEDVAAVREVLRRRRSDLATRLLTVLAGLDRKRAQYERGESFVTAVVDRAGVEGLNRAFDGPASLPTSDEVEDPEAWLARVGASGP